MARQFKEGLDYFELDCQMDDKIKLIQAQFGLKAFAVVVKLFQRIYGGHGYYCEWNEDTLFLFMSENAVDCESKNLIEDIVKACVRRGIFSAELYDRYGILTSSGIQKRYLNAVSKRLGVKLIREYLLVNVDQKSNSGNIYSINDGINSINDGINSQRREEKRKVEKRSKEEKRDNRAAKPPGVTAAQLIEQRGFPSDVEATVKEWARYKIERRQGYKETGLRNLLSQIEMKVSEYGSAAVIDLIHECMANNWKGIIWDIPISIAIRIACGTRKMDATIKIRTPTSSESSIRPEMKPEKTRLA